MIWAFLRQGSSRHPKACLGITGESKWTSMRIIFVETPAFSVGALLRITFRIRGRIMIAVCLGAPRVPSESC